MASHFDPYPCPEPDCPGDVMEDTPEGAFHPSLYGYGPPPCWRCEGFGVVEPSCAEESEECRGEIVHDCGERTYLCAAHVADRGLHLTSCEWTERDCELAAKGVLWDAGRRCWVYGDYIITYDRKPVPTDAFDYDWRHRDYDGAPDSGDRRCGCEASVEDCIASIDEIEAELRDAREVAS